MAFPDPNGTKPETPSIFSDPQAYMQSFEDRMKKLTERAQKAQTTMGEMSAQAQSEEGEVLVTVANGGVMTRLELTPGARHLSPQSLAALIMDTYGRAAAEASERSVAAVAELLGDDPVAVAALKRSVQRGMEGA